MGAARRAESHHRRRGGHVDVASIAVERAMGRGRRQTATREWAFALLDELNSAGDRIRYRTTEAPDADILAATVARARLVRRVLLQDGDAAVEGAWAYVDERLDMPEDAWAPAVVLRASGEAAAVRRWIESLPAESREILEAMPELEGT